MSKLSRGEAREFVNRLTRKYGGILPEELEKISAVAPGVLESLACSRARLASKLIGLLNDRFKNGARFIYELIQNAEENSYNTAKAANERPSLTFTILQDKIIVDSNEDGFGEDDVEAICSIYKDKLASYTSFYDDRGTGFKSVFLVSRRVHIQSGPYAFAFEYVRGDESKVFGVLTPMNAQFEDLPKGIRTRITLALHDDIQLEPLRQLFREVPDTILSFRQKLESLTIVSYSAEGQRNVVTYSKSEHVEYGQLATTLTKSIRSDTGTSETAQRFYMVRKEFCDLPLFTSWYGRKLEGLDYVTINLGFPVDNCNAPVLEQQDIFTILPTQQMGFYFLIQSDLAIEYLPQVRTTPYRRNEAILKGVAETFRDAVVQFNQHPSLCYQWMRYLPGESVQDSLWKGLWPLVRGSLQDAKILKSLSGKAFSYPRDLRKLYNNDPSDKAGQPLVPDLSLEMFLSRGYEESDWPALQRLGTAFLTWEDLIVLLRSDLASPSSRWKSLSSDQDWRTRLCNMLLLPFGLEAARNTQESLKSLKLILLEDERWVSATEMNIHFPPTGNITISPDMGLNLVHAATTANEAWRKLQCHLGVTKYPISLHVAALKSLVEEASPVSEVKRSIMLISRLDVVEKDVVSLLDLKMFPVKCRDGQLRFMKAKVISSDPEFVITDNPTHGDEFQGKIDFLDFSAREVRDARPFLCACNLERQFISKLIKEETTVQHRSIDRDATSELHLKISALVRCATHFASLDSRREPHSLRKLFSEALMYASDGITRSVSIRMHNQTIEGAISLASFHLEELEGRLRLYLPRTKVRKAVCLERHLPRRLLAFLNITDPAAESVIGSIFRQTSSAVIDEILDDAGVASMAFKPNELLESPLNRHELAYRKLLDHVIDLARSRVACDFFSKGGPSDILPPLDDRSIENILDDEDWEGSKNWKRNEDWRHRLGAAGELYVFQYLRSLRLREFGIDNWKSNLRRYARYHEDYCKGEDWEGSGPADIEFDDVDGQFTRLLIERGYLAQSVWAGKRPYYYLEVKATTKSRWQAPFYLSRFQYEHLRGMQLPRGVAAERLYIIVRICGLGQGYATGVDMFVDPETMKQTGQLEFSLRDTIPNPYWLVTPKWMSSNVRQSQVNISQSYQPQSTGYQFNTQRDKPAHDDVRTAGQAPHSYAETGTSSTTTQIPSRPGPSFPIREKAGSSNSIVEDMPNLTGATNTRSSPSIPDQTSSPRISSNGTKLSSVTPPISTNTASTVKTSSLQSPSHSPSTSTTSNAASQVPSKTTNSPSTSFPSPENSNINVGSRSSSTFGNTTNKPIKPSPSLGSGTTEEELDFGKLPSPTRSEGFSTTNTPSKHPLSPNKDVKFGNVTPIGSQAHYAASIASSKGTQSLSDTAFSKCSGGTGAFSGGDEDLSRASGTGFSGATTGSPSSSTHAPSVDADPTHSVATPSSQSTLRDNPTRGVSGDAAAPSNIGDKPASGNPPSSVDPPTESPASLNLVTTASPESATKDDSSSHGFGNNSFGTVKPSHNSGGVSDSTNASTTRPSLFGSQTGFSFGRSTAGSGSSTGSPLFGRGQTTNRYTSASKSAAENTSESNPFNFRPESSTSKSTSEPSLFSNLPGNSATKSTPTPSLFKNLPRNSTTENAPRPSLFNNLSGSSNADNTLRTSLFSNQSGNSATENPSRANLFSNPAESSTTQNTPRSNLFNNQTESTTTESIPKTSLFGNLTQSSTNESAARPTTFDNIFASATGRTSGSTLFNSQARSSAADSIPGSSLFGNTAGFGSAAAENIPKPSLFSNPAGFGSTNRESTPTTNLFGNQPGSAAASNPTSSLFGSSRGFGFIPNESTPRSNLFNNPTDSTATSDPKPSFSFGSPAAANAPRSSLFGSSTGFGSVGNNAGPPGASTNLAGFGSVAGSGAAGGNTGFGSFGAGHSSATTTDSQNLFGSFGGDKSYTNGGQN